MNINLLQEQQNSPTVINLRKDGGINLKPWTPQSGDQINKRFLSVARNRSAELFP